MTEYGIKDDSSLAPWIPFTTDNQFTIPKDKIMVISLAANVEISLLNLQTLLKYKATTTVPMIVHKIIAIDE